MGNQTFRFVLLFQSFPIVFVSFRFVSLRFVYLSFYCFVSFGFHDWCRGDLYFSALTTKSEVGWSWEGSGEGLKSSSLNHSAKMAGGILIEKGDRAVIVLSHPVHARIDKMSRPVFIDQYPLAKRVRDPWTNAFCQEIAL